MNILVIHEIDWIKKVVFDIHMIAESMSLRGHDVYVVDYEDTWGNNSTCKSLNNNVNRVYNEANIHLIRPNFIRIPILSRISAWVSHYFAIKKIIEKYGIDIILLYSVPTNGLQTLYLARKYQIPVIFRSLDILNKLVKYPLLNNVTGLMESIVYKGVDKVLTITPTLSEYTRKRGARNTSVLSMPVDTILFKPFKSNFRNKYGISELDKVILFMGTLFEFSGLDLFIKQMPRILDAIPNAKLVIVGDGKQKKKLESLIKELKLSDNVILAGENEYTSMPDYINMADVCINPFQSNDITKDIFPGKTVQYLACGKPLVMLDLSGVKAVIEGENQGVLYAEDINEMARVVIELLNDKSHREKMANSGFRYVRENHDCLNIAEQLEDISLELIGED